MNIGAGIKLIRKNLGMQQSQLARRSGITQTALSLIETGAQKPSHNTVRKICDTLNISESLIYIISIEESDVPENKKEIYSPMCSSLKSMVMQVVNEKNSAVIEELVAG